MAAWGEGLFGVNEVGHVCVRPDPRRDARIDLAAVVDEVVAGGLALPAVVRFQDVLAARVRALHAAFERAAREVGYGGGYTSVYPVKVNQLREVVDEIVEAGRPFGCGIECGSKAELVATLPRLESDETLCLVNGYKDAAMLRLVLTFQRLGRRVLPVVEKASEFEQILALADAAGQPPAFGVRVKLAAVAPGPWTKSGGSLSKFGVSLPDLVALADRLVAEGAARGAEAPPLPPGQPDRRRRRAEGGRPRGHAGLRRARPARALAGVPRRGGRARRELRRAPARGRVRRRRLLAPGVRQRRGLRGPRGVRGRGRARAPLGDRERPGRDRPPLGPRRRRARGHAQARRAGRL